MDNKKLLVALEKNIAFLENFARNHPEFYDHPLLDEKEGEAFLLALRNAYRAHPESHDPMPEISLNILEKSIQDLKQNVYIHRITGYNIPSMMHYSEFFNLVYLQKGTADLYIENRTFPLTQGNLILIPPRVHNCVHHHEGAELVNVLLRSSTLSNTFFNLINQETFLAAFFSNALYGTNSNYIIWNFESSRILDRLFEACLREFYSGKPYAARMVETYLMQIFIEILRIEEEQDLLPNVPRIPSKEVIHILTQYLASRHYEMTLPQAAAICSYSERHLERIIKEETGHSFVQFKSQVRLQKAASLLKNPDIKIKEISAMLGFSSPAYFGRLFHEQYSMTPKEYRALYTRNGGNSG